MSRLIDADVLKQHYAWWGDCGDKGEENKRLFDEIIDLQPTVGGWVSVKERMPKKEQDVLLRFPHNMAVGFRISFGWCTYSGDGYYTDCDFSDDPDSSSVPTHWMELPAPPEVE